MIAWLIAALICALLIAVLPPITARPRDEFTGRARFLRAPTAHRGLHGGGVPENSLPAFDAAARAGFAIELDVRLCRDGLIVLHDGSMTRPLGMDARARSLTISEIQSRPLFGTAEHAPTFAQALDCVAGRVPLVIELKRGGGRRLVSAVADALRDYEGTYCLESFDPMLLRECRRLLPDAARGLLALSPRTALRRMGPVGWIFAQLLACPVARPHFIACECCDAPSRGLRAWRARGGCCALWTVRGLDEARRAISRGDMAIFEPLPGDSIGG